ncbi:hypothetical protein SD71_10865 [Cohnella kolymensis]|uniref:Uncharacterized protein n=1 Tax=Cohnella kolymensis TaxID=1590652 RepID=A0ABR5A4B0_9BACL|nr:hypothetical protein [Cohnella kolymensis]KIL35882.1 hypothetical protein SD71_10865 [Cohnella kolymensis]
MNVYENDQPLPRINIRSRFDFDDDKPVQGTVFDEVREQIKAEWWHKVLHNLLAINVALLGFVVISWWVGGGFVWGTMFFRSLRLGVDEAGELRTILTTCDVQAVTAS